MPRAMRTDEVVLAFVDAINAHDVDRIVGMCTPDHAFVDAHGSVTPPQHLGSAWSGYFKFMPRYGIEVETVLCEGEVAAIFGSAWGDLDASAASSRAWRRPAAWRARVTGDRIQLWQVYIDTKIVLDLLARPTGG